MAKKGQTFKKYTKETNIFTHPFTTIKKRVKWNLFYKIVIQLLTKNVMCDTINCQQC